eukprot:1160714-Pelagomonas_calceolata.AAC.16
MQNYISLSILSAPCTGLHESTAFATSCSVEFLQRSGRCVPRRAAPLASRAGAGSVPGPSSLSCCSWGPCGGLERTWSHLAHKSPA